MDPATTLNIYTCTDDGPIGWSYAPATWAEDHYMHGVVIEGFYALQTNWLEHEVGHFLGLEHTFLNGCATPNDHVDDTPAQRDGYSGCPVGRDTCPALRGSIQLITSWATTATVAGILSRGAKRYGCSNRCSHSNQRCGRCRSRFRFARKVAAERYCPDGPPSWGRRDALLALGVGRADPALLAQAVGAAKFFTFGSNRVEVIFEAFNVLNNDNFIAPQTTNLVFNFDGHDPQRRRYPRGWHSSV